MSFETIILPMHFLGWLSGSCVGFCSNEQHLPNTTKLTPAPRDLMKVTNVLVSEEKKFKMKSWLKVVVVCTALLLLYLFKTAEDKNLGNDFDIFILTLHWPLTSCLGMGRPDIARAEQCLQTVGIILAVLHCSLLSWLPRSYLRPKYKHRHYMIGDR